MSTTKTNPRVAIITGGSRGIGRQTVRRLAADGYALVVNYFANEAEAEAAVAEAADAGVEAFAARADVADEHAITELFGEAERRFGGVDVVVHAAGRLTLSTVADFDLDELDGCTARTSAGRSSSTSRRLGAYGEVGASSTSPGWSWGSRSPRTPATAPARAPSRQ